MSVDKQIESYTPLVTPNQLKQHYPLSSLAYRVVEGTRQEIRNIFDGSSDKKLLIVGPCSVHDLRSIQDYAEHLLSVMHTTHDKFLILLRFYIQKPRTTNGWPGYVFDPDLNGTYDINKGVIESRQCMIQLIEKGIPLATEYLGTTLFPQYFDDLISFGCIGARTTESQIHRHLVSGLSTPVGFKNSSSGNVLCAIQGCIASSNPHGFMGCDGNGKCCVVRTKGNPHTCVILRGSYENGENYTTIKETREMCVTNGIKPIIIVDCNHGNSNKDYKKQKEIVETVGINNVNGFMIESHIYSGSDSRGVYGISITDPCLGWEETKSLIETQYKNTTFNGQ